MPSVLLTTLNARYIHASLGLRYLFANMGDLHAQADLQEFDINMSMADVAEKLLASKPRIIGIGVYIWNAGQSAELVRMLKIISPETVIVLGGPEVSFETEQQNIVQQADYVITGQGDLEFARLCKALLAGERPEVKIIPAKPFQLNEIEFPYGEYTDEDIATRVVYVEASRGCPFKCEFCLSSLDRTVYPFDLDEFLEQMQLLFDRGVRSFKFIDRTFNLKTSTSIRILEFFLEKLQHDDVYVHFELVPDRLSEELKQVIRKFPEHSIQFEIGIQSFNPEVQQLISRKQDNEKTETNLRWIRSETHAHIHADLIIGLPGETLQSLAEGFNRLVDLNPHEIQVGILKRLRGTPIIRHTEKYDMRYSPQAPYDIISNKMFDFSTMQRLKRFARYWDMLANSGRFKYSRSLWLGDNPFQNFLSLSDWLHGSVGRTHGIALQSLFTCVYQAMTGLFGIEEHQAQKLLMQDYMASGLKGEPEFMRDSESDSKPLIRRPTERRQKRHRN